MSKRLAQIYRAKRKQPAEKYQGKRPTAGHGHAGLASHFLDLAHAKVKPGGVVAFVLPATFTVSSAWSKARELLSTYYDQHHCRFRSRHTVLPTEHFRTIRRWLRCLSSR